VRNVYSLIDTAVTDFHYSFMLQNRCIVNAADLCSHYDQCDIEEREAMLNRFEEQTDLLAERMATLQSLTKHLKNGDHMEINDEEIAILKKKLLASA